VKGNNVIKSDRSEGEDAGISPRKWRNYFTKQELEIAYKELNSGIDSDNNMESDKGSHSDPSADNLDIEETNNFLLSLPNIPVLSLNY